MARRCLVTTVLLVLAGTGLASATTLVQMDLDRLTSAADVVARVRCLENESRWEKGEIWTFTQFEVMEVLKGVAPRLLTVRLLGGRVGHLTSSVDGVPRFRSGEEAVLFLERGRAGDFSVTGWVQGTFRIQRDAHTGHESVAQDSSALAAFDPATRQFRAVGIRRMSLEQFKQRVAEALERHQNRSQP